MIINKIPVLRTIHKIQFEICKLAEDTTETLKNGGGEKLKNAVRSSQRKSQAQ